ncbi:MAG: calcium-binding protein [Pseudomonadota bacterium]
MVASAPLVLIAPADNTLVDMDVLRDGRMVVAYHRGDSLAFVFKGDNGLSASGIPVQPGSQSDLTVVPQVIDLPDGGFAALHKTLSGSYELLRYSTRGEPNFGFPTTINTGDNAEVQHLSTGPFGTLLVTLATQDGGGNTTLSVVEYSIFGAEIARETMDTRPSSEGAVYSEAARLPDGRYAVIAYVPGTDGADVFFSDGTSKALSSRPPLDGEETLAQILTTPDGNMIALVGFVEGSTAKFWATDLTPDTGLIATGNKILVMQGFDGAMQAEAVTTDDGGFKLLVREDGVGGKTLIYHFDHSLSPLGQPVQLAAGSGDLLDVAGLPGNGVVWLNDDSDAVANVSLQGVGTRFNDIEVLGSGTFFDAGDGDDMVFGSTEDDTILGGKGWDTLFGGDGNDRLTLDPDIPESLSLRSVADGGAGDDIIEAMAVQADMRGGSGNDVLLGSVKNDTLNGDGDSDILRGNRGDDLLNGGTGNDLVIGGLGNDTVTGGSHNDILRGDGGHDRVLGGNGRDRITGGTGFDTLEGGLGRDTIKGGADNDLLSGGANSDLFVFVGDGPDDTLGSIESDVITDFTADGSNRDKIRIKSDTVLSFADLDIEGTSGVTYVRYGTREISILSPGGTLDLTHFEFLPIA